MRRLDRLGGRRAVNRVETARLGDAAMMTIDDLRIVNASGGQPRRSHECDDKRHPTLPSLAESHPSTGRLAPGRIPCCPGNASRLLPARHRPRTMALGLWAF